MQSCTGNAIDLENLIKRECEEFLVNTTHTLIAELSYWRLVTWKVREDIVLHPETTINGSHSSVTYIHVTLSF